MILKSSKHYTSHSQLLAQLKINMDNVDVNSRGNQQSTEAFKCIYIYMNNVKMLAFLYNCKILLFHNYKVHVNHYLCLGNTVLKVQGYGHTEANAFF